MSITPEQRQQWREDAEGTDGAYFDKRDARILALLDALDAAERNRAAEVDQAEDRIRQMEARVADMALLDQDCCDRAEQAEATIARVRALADETDARFHMDGDSFGGVVSTDDLRAALGDDR